METFNEAVRRVLTDEWMTAQQVNDGVGFGTVSTVKNYLKAMVKSSTAERKLQSYGYATLYRRARVDAPASPNGDAHNTAPDIKP